MEKTKVVIGMSGGVDSSVAAYLLKKQGYDVIGVTMIMWEGDQVSNPFVAVEDAKRVADHLGISHYVLDFKDTFRACVMDDFVSEYLKGRTPNPCNRCNRFVKFQALLEKAGEFGAAYIATGHYAQILHLENGRYALTTCATGHKDQSYALYNLTQDQLAHILMPLGAYEKSEIRAIAEEIGLEVAKKPDSQDICFIPDGDYQKFLENYTGQKIPAGDYVNAEGKVLGRHKGVTAYTIGQRKGLNLAMGHPVFVTAIDVPNNRVVIGENEDLFHRSLYATHLNMMGIEKIDAPMRFKAKIRYAHVAADCTVMQVNEDRLYVQFDQPQRAFTPGQALVVYNQNYIVCGGLIEGIAPDEL